MSHARWLSIGLLSAVMALPIGVPYNDSQSVFLVKSARSESSQRITELKPKASIRSSTLGNAICTAALSPDGSFVAIGSGLSRHIVIWDIKNNREHLRVDAGS